MLNSIFIYDVQNPDEVKLIKTIPVKNALEIDFSPQGTYISSWIRPIKLEDGAQHKNLQIWSTASDGSDDQQVQEVASFTQKLQEGWKLQFTEDESCALRSIQNEVHLLDPAKNFALTDKLRIEGLANFSLSPGKNPSVAVFVPEKKVGLLFIISSLSTLAAAMADSAPFFLSSGHARIRSRTLPCNAFRSINTEVLLQSR